MKHLLILFCLFPFSLFAQTEISYQSTPSDLNVFQFNIQNIQDNTNSKTVGKFYDSELIILENGITSQFQKLIIQNLKTPNNYTLKVNNIQIYERLVNEIYLANVGLNVTIYNNTNSYTYQNCVYISLQTSSKKRRGNVYAKHLNILFKKALKNFSRQIEKPTTKPIVAFSPNHADGVYTSYAHYLQNNPNKSINFNLKTIPNSKEFPENFVCATITDPNTRKKLKSVWGVVKKGHLYINVFGIFHLIKPQQPENSYTYTQKNFYFQSTSGAIAGGVLGGIIGGAIGAAIDNKKNEKTANPYKVKFDHNTGGLQLNPLQFIDIKKGAYLQLSLTNNQTFSAIEINDENKYLNNGETIFAPLTNEGYVKVCTVTKADKNKCQYLKLHDKPFKAYTLIIDNFNRMYCEYKSSSRKTMEIIEQYYTNEKSE